MFVFSWTCAFAQTYLMPMSGSVSYTICAGCAADFYDGGGPGGNYTDGQHTFLTFYPADTINQKVSVDFSSFSTYLSPYPGSETDNLRVYNGSSTKASEIANLFNTVAPGTIISTASNGSWTFEFDSYFNDDGHVGAGWSATVSCVTPLSIPSSGNITMKCKARKSLVAGFLIFILTIIDFENSIIRTIFSC
jgi:hypothetical protein